MALASGSFAAFAFGLSKIPVLLAGFNVMDAQATARVALMGAAAGGNVL